MKMVSVRDTEELRTVLEIEENEEPDYDEFVIDLEGTDDKIVLFSPAYFIHGFNYLVLEGSYLTKDEKGEYFADWSLTAIYKWESPDRQFTEDDAAKYVYYEQGSPWSAIHNFMRYDSILH